MRQETQGAGGGPAAPSPARQRLAAAGFEAVVRTRASVRSFRDEPVPRDDVRLMVELATRAANAGNAQPWLFVAVEDVGTKEAMRAAVAAAVDAMAGWPEARGERRALAAVRRYATFFAAAPVVVAVFVLPYESTSDRLMAAHGLDQAARDRLRARPDLQSVGAAVQTLCLAAHAMGYGACWMTAPVLAAEELERLLGAPPQARLAALVPVGRPRRQPRPTRRRPVDEVLSFR